MKGLFNSTKQHRFLVGSLSSLDFCGKYRQTVFSQAIHQQNQLSPCCLPSFHLSLVLMLSLRELFFGWLFVHFAPREMPAVLAGGRISSTGFMRTAAPARAICRAAPLAGPSPVLSWLQSARTELLGAAAQPEQRSSRTHSHNQLPALLKISPSWESSAFL